VHQAALLAAPRILHLEETKVGPGLVVSVKPPRCFTFNGATYTCLGIAETNHRPGEDPNYLGGLNTWTVTVRVDPATHRMYVAHSSEGLEPPEPH
jgi:hypothetical protein